MHPAPSSSRLSSPGVCVTPLVLRDFQRPDMVKVTTQDKPKPAGATPPFDASCVTAYLGSLPPQPTAIPACVRPRERTLSNRSYAAPHTICPTRFMMKRRRVLPLLNAQPKQPKSAATIQIRVEEDVKLRIDKYAEFIDSSPAYVVTGALKLLFNKDGEFKSWLRPTPPTALKLHVTHRKQLSRKESPSNWNLSRNLCIAASNSVCARIQRPQGSMPRA